MTYTEAQRAALFAMSAVKEATATQLGVSLQTLRSLLKKRLVRHNRGIGAFQHDGERDAIVWQLTRSGIREAEGQLRGVMYGDAVRMRWRMRNANVSIIKPKRERTTPPCATERTAA